MVLVRGIGMSGYLPLEGVVGLSHALVNYNSDKCEYEYKYGFHYLRGVDIDRTTKLDVLRSIVSFAVAHRFNDSARFTIIRDVGLLSGYYRAGVVFSGKLHYMLRDDMRLEEYRNLTYPCFHLKYPSLNFVFTSAWAEYICLDPDVSYAYCPPISIRILGYKNPFPTYTCDELRHALGQ